MSELAFENLGVARVSSIKEEKHLKTSKMNQGIIGMAVQGIITLNRKDYWRLNY